MQVQQPPPSAPADLQPGEAPAASAAAPLQRPFRAIVFDWDGTAVASRQEAATALAALLAALLERGVWIVIVTGTHFGHIDRQLCHLLPPAVRRRLLVCTNRGSEVYGFRPDGTPVCRYRRLATAAEERALTVIAEAVRDQLVAQTGLEIRIVYDRLNRRKIDLIPVPEWADPPKEQIGALLAAVEARLQGAGLAGGLGEAFRLAQQLAQAYGLPEARITSDAKHIEVGLTDKGDALAWVRQHLFGPEGIALADVLIVGDEFGPVAGFAGSDDRLRQEAPGAVVVSVGVEPNGVPAGVLHLGGGPARFRALLADQVARHPQARVGSGEQPAGERRRAEGREAADLLAPTPDPAWRLEVPSYQPALEHEEETRLAISNGFLGVRGSLEQPTRASRPRTFIAGLFDVPAEGVAVPTLVPGPDWLRLRLLLDGEPLSLERGELLTHTRTLDWRRGVLLSEWRQCDPAGRVTRLRTLRFVSLAERALAGQLAEIAVEQPTPLTLEARIEPPATGLQPVCITAELGVWRTLHAARQLALAWAPALQRGRRRLRPHAGEGLQRCWHWPAAPGEPARFSRLVAVARGGAGEDPAPAARATLRRARRAGLRRLLAAHARAWAARWAASDVVVEGDAAAQRALRYALYHLNSAANPEDPHVSIGARALTGDAYFGHVFWDTEIFLLPFYAFTWPAAARALLLYRYHTLPAARAKAARLGYRGALYAWESADTGEETTPPYVIGPDGQVIVIRAGTDEQHISADVAYAVWQYWQATGDTAFLLEAGAEIILETARFWASRATLEADGRYHIRGVIGPDEYHEGVDDNAYTNGMAQWNLERGVEVARLLARRWPERWAALEQRLGLTALEIAQWEEVAARLVTGLDPTTHLIEQFAGYFALEPIDLAAYEPRTAPMDVLLGPERTRRSQVIKQADVVMLLALLWERYPPEVREANFRYYEPRCGHGSSLSPPVHALVAARLGLVELAERYFHQTAAIDLDDTMGNAALGVHIGALGGLWQATVLGFAGLALRPDGLAFTPHLPPRWRALQFSVQWRGRRVRVRIAQEPALFTATLERGRPLTIAVGTCRYRLGPGQAIECRWDRALADASRIER
ncbi:MAG TPA: glycosyl hydrolase family 65 protein [Chloroflexota bacterium]|nr:glycosyl hydrolase family 65 protein [Chloroflexota bacterium]